MKLLIIFLAVFLIFCSCSKHDEKTAGSDIKKDSTPATIQNNDNLPGSPAKNNDKKSDINDNNKGAVIKLKFDKNNIPSDCKFKGRIVDGARWKDKNGENILIITQTDVKRVNQDVRNQYIYGYMYTAGNDKWKQLWNITDFVESYCDVEAKYIPGTLELSDLDGDGIAENLFIYKLDGRCDVSPIPIKLMMHSGDKKLVIRGDTNVDFGNGQKFGGKKTFDDAFDSVPSSFKEYASKKWDNFMKDNPNP